MMDEFFTMQDFEASVSGIRQHTKLAPKVGLILGSGLNALADSVESAVKIPFGDIPNFPVSTVEGHQGRLVFGMLEGKLAIYSYQGMVGGLQPVALPAGAAL